MITPGSEYAWIIPGYADYTRTYMNMPKYAWIAFVLHVPIVIPCLLECVLSYFLEEAKFGLLFGFRLNVFTSKI